MNKLFSTLALTSCLLGAHAFNAAPAEAGQIDKLLHYVPDETPLVATIDFDLFKKSPLGPVAMSYFKQQLGLNNEELSKALGVDLLSDLHAFVLFAGDNFVAANDTLCFLLDLPIKEERFTSYMKEGGVPLATTKSENGKIYFIDKSAFVFKDNFTLICHQDLINKALNASKLGLAQSKKHKQTLQSANKQIATLSLFIEDKLLSALPKDVLPSDFKDFKGFNAILNQDGKAFKLVAHTLFDNPKAAEESIQELNVSFDQLFQKDELAAFGLKRDIVSLKRSGNNVEISIVLDETLLNTLTALFTLAGAVNNNAGAVNNNAESPNPATEGTK